MKKGFTLIELIIVVMIIVILAGIALPQFSKTKEHAIGKEAIANLKLIAAAEKIYRMEAVTGYYPIPAGIVNDTGGNAAINTNLRLSIPLGSAPLYTNRNWSYSITDNNTVVPPTFSSTASRVSGPYSSCQYSINQSQDEPVVASGTCP